jgi:peptidoglycan/LPS O-acetylase OafA/YrhL
MRLESLTGLRIILAILVVIAHASFRVGFLKQEGWIPDFLSHTGHFGVIGFFVLSGFILQKVYDQRTWTLRSFTVNRIARLYPIYLCGLLFALPIDWYSPNMPSDHRTEALGLSLVLLQSWTEFANGRFNGPGWTLSVEAFFYAAFPLLFILIRKKPWVFAILFCVLITYTATIWEAASSYRFPFNRLWEFMAGMLGVKLINSGKFKLCSMPWWSSILVLIISFFAGCYLIVNTDLAFFGWFTMTMGCWTCILILASIDIKEKVSNPLSSKIFILGGEISYGLYIFHDPIQRYSKVIFERILSNELEKSSILLKSSYIASTTVVSFVAAYIGWLIIEKPARVFIRNRLGGD